MHLVGIWWDFCDNLFDKEFIIFVNSLCNCAVTIFMLISGYYGIRFNLKKIIRFEMMVLFYSILFILVQYCLIGGVGAKEMVSSVFPLLTSKYWFYTAYVGDYSQAFLIKINNREKYVMSCRHAEKIVEEVKSRLKQ